MAKETEVISGEEEMLALRLSIMKSMDYAKRGSDLVPPLAASIQLREKANERGDKNWIRFSQRAQDEVFVRLLRLREQGDASVKVNLVRERRGKLSRKEFTNVYVAISDGSDDPFVACIAYGRLTDSVGEGELLKLVGSEDSKQLAVERFMLQADKRREAVPALLPA